MADEKQAKDAKQENKQDKPAENKVIAWFKALPKRIAKPFKNMVTELRRVTWPSKQKLIRYSIIVLVFLLIMMIIIGLFDLGFSELVQAIRPGQSTENSQTTEPGADEDPDRIVASLPGSDEGDDTDLSGSSSGEDADPDGSGNGEDADPDASGNDADADPNGSGNDADADPNSSGNGADADLPDGNLGAGFMDRLSGFTAPQSADDSSAGGDD